MRWLTALVLLPAAYAQIGVFDQQVDIGASREPGSAKFDSTTGVYTVSGGGSNMWFGSDAFHYVFKQVSGDLSATAGVKLLGTSTEPHRKAGWMIRQSLEPDSPYVDLIVHGDGTSSMQFRPTKGANTDEVRSTVTSPAVIRLERHGDAFELWAAAAGEEPHKVGSTTVKLQDPVYVGLAVCAHNVEHMETAEFSGVKLETKK